MLILQSLTYIKRKWPNRQAHLQLCHRNTDILEKVLHWITLSNSIARKWLPKQVVTQASCKTTRTWHDFNNQGTKMILLSDELWLIANNSRSFSNWSKPIIRNNLGLCKGCQNLPYLELLKTLSWIEWYKNIDLAMKDLSNKLMIFGGDRKKGRILSFSGKRLFL